MSVSNGASKSANVTTLPPELQQSIYSSLPPIQIASLASLTRATTPIINCPKFWAEISERNLRAVPDNPSPRTVRALADSLACRWWLLNGLFVPGVVVHRRSGFLQVLARGGVELPIVHPEKVSCYVFGGQHESAAIPVINPSVSLCFLLDPAGPFPVHGMRLSVVHTVEIPDTPAYLNIGPSSPPDEESLKADEPYAAVTVIVNNTMLLKSFRPKDGNFQVTHIHVPSDVLVTTPRMNHISVEYDRSSTAAYWLKEVSMVPSILPPSPEEKTATAIRIGEPLPLLEPQHSPETQSDTTPSSNRRSNQTHHNHHRRAVRRLPEHSFKQHVSDVHPVPRYQKAQHVTNKPKHMYHHNYFRSPRRSAPTSPKARSAR